MDARPDHCPCGHPEPGPSGLCIVCCKLTIAWMRWLRSPAFDKDRALWEQTDRAGLARRGW
jgi:hypothetical protein